MMHKSSGSAGTTTTQLFFAPLVAMSGPACGQHNVKRSGGQWRCCMYPREGRYLGPFHRFRTSGNGLPDSRGGPVPCNAQWISITPILLDGRCTVRLLGCPGVTETAAYPLGRLRWPERDRVMASRGRTSYVFAQSRDQSVPQGGLLTVQLPVKVFLMALPLDQSPSPFITNLKSVR